MWDGVLIEVEYHDSLGLLTIADHDYTSKVTRFAINLYLIFGI